MNSHTQRNQTRAERELHAAPIHHRQLKTSLFSWQCLRPVCLQSKFSLLSLHSVLEVCVFKERESVSEHVSVRANVIPANHYFILKLLRAQDPPWPWDERTCQFAAMNGHISVLQWLRHQDPPCPWSSYTCSLAAQKGHRHVLQWAREQDPPCPWDSITCRDAARNGHLSVLQWARQQDPPCPWDSDTCLLAAQNGHLSLLQWARQQDPPCPWDKAGCHRAAIYKEHVVAFIDSGLGD